MNKYSAIVCASLLAITLGACGGGDNASVDPADPTDGSTAVSGAEGAGSTAVSGTAAETAGAPRAQSFAPLQSDNSVVRVRSLPALIDSTPAAARINGTASGKADPFAGRVISVRPVPPEPQEVNPVFPLAGGRTSPASAAGNALTGGNAGAAPQAAASNAGQGRAATPAGAGAGRNAGGTGVSPGAAAGAGNRGNLPDLAAKPAIPDPVLARGVEVTGIVQIGSVYQAIVKAPNEPTARYVTVGQRLSNGRVLVKRIENQGSEPVVILEEDGVEVVRSIGAPVESPAGRATAQLPQLQPAS